MFEGQGSSNALLHGYAKLQGNVIPLSCVPLE